MTPCSEQVRYFVLGLGSMWMVPSGPGNLLLFIRLFFPVVSSSKASNRDKSPVKGGSEVQTSEPWWAQIQNTPSLFLLWLSLL